MNCHILPRPCVIAAATLLAGMVHHAPADDILRVVGAASVNVPVAQAVQILRVEQSMDIQISTIGGSAAGIAAVGEGQADIGMISEPLQATDRSEFPDVLFKEIYLGQQVVVPVVSRDVHLAGIKSLSPDQARRIYQRELRNWKEIGGPDLPITFFNPVEGTGTWELFAKWMYGNTSRVPLGQFPTVASSEEARNSVEFTRGALSVMAPAWIEGEKVFALALETPDGPVEATPQNIASGKYPMSRPLFFVVNDRPTGKAKVLVDFMLGERGQELIRKAGYLTRREILAAGGNQFLKSDPQDAAP